MSKNVIQLFFQLTLYISISNTCITEESLVIFENKYPSGPYLAVRLSPLVCWVVMLGPDREFSLPPKSPRVSKWGGNASCCITPLIPLLSSSCSRRTVGLKNGKLCNYKGIAGYVGEGQ